MSRYKLTTGGAGEEIFEFDVGAQKADVDLAYQQAWESTQDETGSVSVARLAKMRAFQMARFRGAVHAEVEAYLRQRQAKMGAKYSELVGTLRTPIYNTETAICFRQLGYGTVVQHSIDAPRSTPAVVVGFSSLSFTMRAIGLQQWSYRSFPLVDTVNQSPPYSAYAGPIAVNWVPLSWMQNEYDRNCNTSCFPRFLGGRIWYPTALFSVTLVQVASVGDDAVPFQDHSITILCATAFECEPKGWRSVLTPEAIDGVRTLRAQFGFL